MDIRKIISLAVISMLSIVLFADSSLFPKLKRITDLKPDENLAVIYQTNGACIKCYMQPNNKIEEIKKEGKIDKIKIIALVRCSRDLELQIFKKNHGWEHFVARDDGTAKQKLGVQPGSYLTIFDSNGKKLYDFE
jgi:hypothetical protein